MYSTTGFTRGQIDRLVIMIRDLQNAGYPVAYPPSLGLRKSIIITMTHLRRNHTQADLADRYATSQPTISRTIAAMTPALADATADWIPVADDLDPDVPLIIDETLLPCWSWADIPDLYSGKHHTTGVNVHIAATLSGRLLWVSDPLPGSTHDLTALRTHGVLDTEDLLTIVADKGYIGAGLITPIKKPPGGELTDDRKQFNKELNAIRATIERTIAHLKTWRILHTDYRRPYHTFAQTITAVLGLQFLKLAS
ncbi:MAG: transposase family protein [Tetrasphaera sp.]